MSILIEFKAKIDSSQQDFPLIGLEGHHLAEKLQTTLSKKTSIFSSYNQWIVEFENESKLTLVKISSIKNGIYHKINASFPEETTVQNIERIWRWATENSLDGKFETYNKV